MRREGARLGVDSQRLERSIDIGGELGEIWRSGNAAPENARAALVGEETHAAEMEFDGLRGVNRSRAPLGSGLAFHSSRGR